MYQEQMIQKNKNTEDYFLAGRSLPWWAIGASLIAANISAEQIIGMSGQGFVVGMAIAVWELTNDDNLGTLFHNSHYF